ncbi:hypothetical protein PVAG01_04081 [Phlyctema vagabunda]|uniref:Uncharacterized protein n=1 Tax=Phlyctema vagabunda TaxID=108571 RepID=A0ABR4PNA3_9HELO
MELWERPIQNSETHISLLWPSSQRGGWVYASTHRGPSTRVSVCLSRHSTIGNLRGRPPGTTGHDLISRVWNSRARKRSIWYSMIAVSESTACMACLCVLVSREELALSRGRVVAKVEAIAKYVSDTRSGKKERRSGKKAGRVYSSVWVPRTISAVLRTILYHRRCEIRASSRAQVVA